jgi:RNase P/RNase MRP subunit p30
MNGDERDRIEALAERLIKVEILLSQLLSTSGENKKQLKGIFTSIIVGVAMLLITTIVAKVT